MSEHFHREYIQAILRVTPTIYMRICYYLLLFVTNYSEKLGPLFLCAPYVPHNCMRKPTPEDLLYNYIIIYRDEIYKTMMQFPLGALYTLLGRPCAAYTGRAGLERPLLWHTCKENSLIADIRRSIQCCSQSTSVSQYYSLESLANWDSFLIANFRKRTCQSALFSHIGICINRTAWYMH
jgi:hypothetical protein